MSVAKIGFGDNLAFNLFHVLPYFLRGIFIRCPRTYSLLSSLGANPFSHAFARRLASKYGSTRLLIKMGLTDSLLLLDVEDVQHVLDRSPDIYAENALKLKGMSYFQPHSLTISHGDAWRRRRDFNEAALDSANALHRHADRFAAAVAGAVDECDARHFQGIADAFERIMLAVVFGDHQAFRALSATHKKLMFKANRVIALRASERQARMAGEIRQAMAESSAPCLIGDATVPFDNHGLQAENQVSHWMFATRDTLAVNCARALALISASPESLARAREEIGGHDLSTARDIAKLKYIEGSLQEAMRLWPTTPALARASLRRDMLGEDEIAAGSQIVVFTQYLHRDTTGVPDAERFNPERWNAGRDDPRFNHLSNGPQVCAGKNLALFLGTAALARLVSRGYVLDSPGIDLDRPIPPTFNYFRLRFTRTNQA